MQKKERIIKYIKSIKQHDNSYRKLNQNIQNWRDNNRN